MVPLPLLETEVAVEDLSMPLLDQVTTTFLPLPLPKTITTMLAAAAIIIVGAASVHRNRPRVSFEHIIIYPNHNRVPVLACPLLLRLKMLQTLLLVIHLPNLNHCVTRNVHQNTNPNHQLRRVRIQPMQIIIQKDQIR